MSALEGLDNWTQRNLYIAPKPWFAKDAAEDRRTAILDPIASRRKQQLDALNAVLEAQKARAEDAKKEAKARKAQVQEEKKAKAELNKEKKKLAKEEAKVQAEEKKILQIELKHQNMEKKRVLAEEKAKQAEEKRLAQAKLKEIEDAKRAELSQRRWEARLKQQDAELAMRAAKMKAYEEQQERARAAARARAQSFAAMPAQTRPLSLASSIDQAAVDRERREMRIRELRALAEQERLKAAEVAARPRRTQAGHPGVSHVASLAFADEVLLDNDESLAARRVSAHRASPTPSESKPPSQQPPAEDPALAASVNQRLLELIQSTRQSLQGGSAAPRTATAAPMAPIPAVKSALSNGTPKTPSLGRQQVAFDKAVDAKTAAVPKEEPLPDPRQVTTMLLSRFRPEDEVFATMYSKDRTRVEVTEHRPETGGFQIIEAGRRFTAVALFPKPTGDEEEFQIGAMRGRQHAVKALVDKLVAKSGHRGIYSLTTFAPDDIPGHPELARWYAVGVPFSRSSDNFETPYEPHEDEADDLLF